MLCIVTMPVSVVFVREIRDPHPCPVKYSSLPLLGSSRKILLVQSYQKQHLKSKGNYRHCTVARFLRNLWFTSIYYCSGFDVGNISFQETEHVWIGGNQARDVQRIGKVGILVSNNNIMIIIIIIIVMIMIMIMIIIIIKTIIIINSE